MKGTAMSYDVIVVGTGIAGLYTALELPTAKKVLILSKGSYKETNSYLAQGGIAAAVSDEDSPQSHFDDTLKCGHYKGSEAAIRHMVTTGPERVRDLIENYGAVFDSDETGYLLALEGAHSVKRILRVSDHTGQSVLDTLYQEILKRPNITTIENAYVYNLIVENGRCHGVHVLLEGGPCFFTANHTVLATGGVGHLFKRTTNAKGIDGSGLALALKANLKLEKPSLLQFHPTGLYQEDLTKPHFLISEAVRGEGAKLFSADGSRFMTAIHELAELAPRDVVSKAISDEMKRTQTPYVWLDVTHQSKSFLSHRFPTIYEKCRVDGYAMEEQRIPVVPCMHYFMGGIPTDLKGQTELAGLYAVGECAYTGVHGLNRLASNSLLEAIVFAHEAAHSISEDFLLSSNMEVQGIHQIPDYNVSKEELTTWMEQLIGIKSDKQATLNRIDHILQCPMGMGDVSVQRLEVLDRLLLIREMLKDLLEG